MCVQIHVASAGVNSARVCVCVCVSPHVVVLRFHASVLAAFALHCALTAENSGKPLEKEEQAGSRNNRNERRRRRCLLGKLLI